MLKPVPGAYLAPWKFSRGRNITQGNLLLVHSSSLCHYQPSHDDARCCCKEGARDGFGLPLAARPSVEPLSGSAPAACPTNNFYSVSNALSTFVPDTAKKVYGQTGVTLNVTAEAGTEWSGTVGGSVEGDVSFIVASAKATVSASVSYTKTHDRQPRRQLDRPFETVPSNQSLGWLALGSQGYVMSWEYGANTAQCKYEKIRGESATLPAMSPVVGHS